MRSNFIEFRNQAGFTQEQLGRLTKKNKQYVWMVEHSKRKGSADFWLLIQEKFNLTCEKLNKLRKEDD